jgi:hypothetical protein
MAELRECRVCGEVKPPSEFYGDKPSRRCKECEKAYQRDRYHNGVGKRQSWANYIKRTHGITADEYEDMFDEQDGKCLICGRTEEEAYPDGRRHAVDHDHETGRIRGILCGNCNQAIGHMNDDVQRLFDAARYLIERA